MTLKMNHLLGGIAGGLVFGLVAGLLMGSCVFPAGPNHRTVAGMLQAEGEIASGSSMAGGGMAPAGGPSGDSTPAGMDPGGGVMESIFAKVAELKRRVETDPKDRGAVVQLANLYYDANKFDQAIEYYEKALTLDRKDPNVLTDMANSYWLAGNVERAKELLKEAQQSFPDHWQSAGSLFFLAVTARDSALAKEALERVRSLNPGFEKLPEMEKLYEDMARGGRG